LAPHPPQAVQLRIRSMPCSFAHGPGSRSCPRRRQPTRLTREEQNHVQTRRKYRQLSRESCCNKIRRMLSGKPEHPPFLLHFRLQTVHVIQLFFRLISALAAAAPAECCTVWGRCEAAVVASPHVCNLIIFRHFLGYRIFPDDCKRPLIYRVHRFYSEAAYEPVATLNLLK
jgi:hypothetical protein